MLGQTFKLENKWWVRFQKEITYGDNLIMNRTSWAPIRSKWPMSEGDWVDFELKRNKVGSTTNGPVYEEYALINNFLNEDM